jgi:peptide chain release factor subunit 1
MACEFPGMDKSTFGLETPLRDQLTRLAAFEATDGPVVSVYLDLRPDQQGKQSFDTFLRKTFAERAAGMDGAQRQSFDADVARITEYLATELRDSAMSVAIFACASTGFFEAIQLDAPIEGHWVFVGAVPHLYPLARANDQHPRYAAVLLDTNSARIFVFSLAAVESRSRVQNVKTRRTMVGGWSQARYQRHVDNFHLHHMKDVAAALDRIVRQDRIERIVLSCDEVTKPQLLAELPKHLAEKIVDVVRLDIRAPEHQVLHDTLEALRAKDADTDADKVQVMLDGWRSGGLGVAGPEATLMALSMGQVEELLITASPGQLHAASVPEPLATAHDIEVDTTAEAGGADAERMQLADDLVTKAQQSSARIRFIEDPTLLADVGGVGAILRFRI